MTYYKVDYRQGDNPKLYTYEGKPHGEYGIMLSKRAGLELGCAKLVLAAKLKETPQAALEQLRQTKHATVSALEFKLERERRQLMSLPAENLKKAIQRE